MTERVDYDTVAADYEGRYERNDYTGIERALHAFMQNGPRAKRGNVLEVGCGTGHWLRFFRESGIDIAGVDPSERMLNVARIQLADARLIRARAESIPCRTASLDRIFCVNALHHFSDRMAFFREARRVLSDGGGLLTIGLDPHTGLDRWWIYDYFPSAPAADRRRYLPAAQIRELMSAAGFSRCETREAQYIPSRMTVAEAARRGFLTRTSTSQLMVISDAEYEAGLKRIQREDAELDGGKVLRADLRVYGTTAWTA
jgi:ubiquinone/menaquinone biosynthesis C-methylase UbiE